MLIRNPQSAIRNPKSVCFVTGTRAEFGLMRSTLRAIRDHPYLQLQIVVTGMHLDRSRGRTVNSIRAEGWTVDRIVPWRSADAGTRAGTARATGRAMAGLADAFAELRPDVVLVVGDRVEAFAAAAAGHLCGAAVAHVHGGDRAAGQADDSLRHAVSKLAHVHFPATRQSEQRLLRLGEDRWRVHRSGSPGIDGIKADAAAWADVVAAFPGLGRRQYALVVLHPADADERVERDRAATLLRAATEVGYPSGTVVVYPNNDPGAGGIVRCWEEAAKVPVAAPSRRFVRDVPRPLFLGLMRDAAVLVGNSSSGIIEAASFGTPVVDVGPRQRGREHGGNVTHVAYGGAKVRRALAALWNDGRPARSRAANPYGGDGAGRKIAAVLAGLRIDDRLLRKLIAY